MNLEHFLGGLLLKIFTIKVGLIIIAATSISLIFTTADAQTPIGKINQLGEMCNSSGASLTEIATAIDSALASQDGNKMFACGLFSSKVANFRYALGGSDLQKSDYERYDLLAGRSLLSALELTRMEDREYLLSLIHEEGLDSFRVRKSEELLYAVLVRVFSNDASGADFITRPPMYTLMITYLIKNKAVGAYFRGLFYLYLDDDSVNRRIAAENISMAARIISEDRNALEDDFLETRPLFKDDFIKDLHVKNCYLGLFWSTQTESIVSGFESCRRVLVASRDDKRVLGTVIGLLALAEIISYPNYELSDSIFYKLNMELQDLDHMSQKFIQKLDNCLASSKGCNIELLEQRFTYGSQIYETYFLNSSLRARLKIQTALSRRNVYHGKIDGLWGPLTANAIEAAARNLGSNLRSPADFTDLLFSLTPVSDGDVNSIEKEIISKNIASSMSNYAPSYVARPRTSIRPRPSFMSDLNFPEPDSSGFDSGFSSIYIGNRFINCYSGGGFTTCN